MYAMKGWIYAHESPPSWTNGLTAQVALNEDREMENEGLEGEDIAIDEDVAQPLADDKFLFED